MTGSGDIAPVNGGQVFGRTKYDLLASFRWVFVLLIVGLLAYLGLRLYAVEGLSVDTGGAADAITELWPFGLAFLFGVWFFHMIYWRWIVRGVVLLKESSPMASYIVTKEAFDRIPGSQEAVCSSYTKTGLPVYRVRSIDLLLDQVEFGRQHLGGMSFGEVLTFPDKYEAMLSAYLEAETERNMLRDRTAIIGLYRGHQYSDALLRSVESVALGEDPFAGSGEFPPADPPAGAVKTEVKNDD